MKLGLALSGGGTRGCFQMGAAKFLYEEWGIRPDVIASTSVGSVNGLMLAHGGEKCLQNLEAAWRALQGSGDMYREEDWLAELYREYGENERAILDSLRMQAATTVGGSVLTGAGLAVAWPLGVIAGIATYWQASDFTSRLEGFMRRVQAAKSVYTLAPLREFAQQDGAPWQLKPQEVASSGIELRMAVVSLESGWVRYVDQNGRFVDTGDGPFDLLEAAMASSAIPGVFPPVSLGDDTCVDGGVREVLPIRGAFEAGADRVYAIACAKIGADPQSSFASRNLADISRRAVMDLLPDEILRSEVHPDGQGWRGTVVTISPEWNVNDAMTLDPANIALAIDYGWMQAADRMRRFEPGTVSEEAARIDPELLLRQQRLEVIGQLEPVMLLGDLVHDDVKGSLDNRDVAVNEIARDFGKEAGIVGLEDEAAIPWDLPALVEELSKFHISNNAISPGEMVDVLDTGQTREWLRQLVADSRAAQEDPEDVAALLAARQARRPQTRSEQLSTAITVARQELANAKKLLMAVARPRDQRSHQGWRAETQRILSRIAVLRSEVGALVDERRSLGGALPATAPAWPDRT